MSTLTFIIHTPQCRVSEIARSFKGVFATGIGVGYGLTPEMSQMPPGTPVVLLRKDTNKRRAEGQLVDLKTTGRATRNGRKRYQVTVFRNMKTEGWYLQDGH